MRSIILLCIAACCGAVFCGCETAHIKVGDNGTWEAWLSSHWLSRDIDSFAAQVQEGGKFTMQLNGYKGDVSEQLPAFTKEMWSGLAILGRLAGSAINPAVAAVPLSDAAAEPAAVSSIVTAAGNAKAQTIQAKKTTTKTQTATQSSSTDDCPDGNCELNP